MPDRGPVAGDEGSPTLEVDDAALRGDEHPATVRTDDARRLSGAGVGEMEGEETTDAVGEAVLLESAQWGSSAGRPPAGRG